MDCPARFIVYNRRSAGGSRVLKAIGRAAGREFGEFFNLLSFSARGRDDFRPAIARPAPPIGLGIAGNAGVLFFALERC
jgi:hypothetical protein